MERMPKWQFYVHREFNIFVEWVQTVATRSDVQRRVFGFSVPLTNYLILSGDEFADAKDQDSYEKFLSKKLKTKPDFFTSFAKREQKLADVALAFQNRLQQSSARYASFTNKQLLAEFEKFLSVYIPIFGTAFVRPDDFLEQRLKILLTKKYSKLRVEELFSILATYPPNKANQLSYLQEPVDLLKIAIALKKANVELGHLPKSFQLKLELHLRRYLWLKNPSLTELVSVTRLELLQRLRYLLQNDPAKQLREMQNARKTQIHQFQQLLKQEHFSKEILQAIKDVQTFIFLRTYTTESADRLFYVARTTLFAEIAQRMKLSSALVCTCTGDEIVRFFEINGVPSKSELIRRQKNFVVLWKNAKGKILFGKEAKVYLKKYAKLRSGSQNSSTELRGQTAFPGQVQGKVRVLKHWKESARLRKGEILVVSMTTPEYIQAMEKAAAFVTDEGGITCHAAIIAREMQKSCVIGTKIATKTLKTGDRVEVDAERGIVQIIKYNDILTSQH